MWIVLALVYAFTNALYITYNDKRHYNAYILGMWRGFGVSFCMIPFLSMVPWTISPEYLGLLIGQGILIGIYDSRLFFASAKFGGHTGSGFVATAVLITAFMWWATDIESFQKAVQRPTYFLSLMLVLSLYSVCYWQMMKVQANAEAERFLYPAVLALAMMSVATRYIALWGGAAYMGVIYYLTIACFFSGIYNTVMYYRYKNRFREILKPKFKDGAWLVFFSLILIAAKTEALRICVNPGYVVAVLLLSPLIGEVIEKKIPKLTPIRLAYFILLAILLWLVQTYQL